MDKKYSKKIDYKILQQLKDNSINASILSGLRRIRKGYKFMFYTCILNFIGLSCIRYYTKVTKKLSEQKTYLMQLKASKVSAIMMCAHRNSISEFSSLALQEKDEVQKGLFKYRVELLSKAEGTILETCCGKFLNSTCYNTKNKENIKSIIAIDWSKEVLDLAKAATSDTSNVTFLEMDARDLKFADECFDTVVDTFGMQYCQDPITQFQELKRVCKTGGKILLLESGKSYWATKNFQLTRQSDFYLNEYGCTPFIDWTQIIENDPEIEILKHKRRNNGELYYYELKKK